MGLVNWGLLSVSIFSNILNLFIVSVFSVSWIFGFGVGFRLSLSVFFFWREVCRSGGLYWGSFDLVLLGDFDAGCFIGRVVRVIAVFSSVSFFPNRVSVWRMIPLCFLQDPLM